MLPEMVNISETKMHDCYRLAQLIFAKNTFIVEDSTYFDFELMLSRIKAENLFVTRIKSNTVYNSIVEIDLPNQKDQDIVKDEIIQLSSKKAIKTRIQH